MTYIGGAAVARNNEHISISIILDRLGQRTPRLRTALSLITDVIVVVFLGMALYGTYLNTVNNWTTPVGGISGIMSGYIYFGIGLGVFAMVIYEIDDAVESTKSILGGLRRKSVGNEEVREDG
jgi:TRAP-type C4-dicarboxylate transport system permease small subunit